MTGPYVAVIRDEEMYEEASYVLADTVAELAAVFGDYLAKTGAPAQPPPPIDSDHEGWEEWLAQFLRADSCPHISIEIYGPEPEHVGGVLVNSYYSPRQMREWTQRAAPGLAYSRRVNTVS